MVFDSSDEGSITAGNYPQFRFYTAATDGVPLAETEPLEDGTYYISTFADLYCESSRTQLTVTFATPQIELPPAQSGDPWSSTKWVGAFWKDNQTGERIIASTNTTAWSASIDFPDGAGSWLTLDQNGGYDPNLWTDTPGDAESYQFPATRKTEVSGTGNILFRIGATSTNPNSPNPAYKYPDGTVGKQPRYATITLTVDGTLYTIYCRQGEAADYVFSTSDTYNDPNDNTTSGNDVVPRSLAKKFSPYNLTNTDITDGTNGGFHTGVAADGINYKGKFVDYPTQAGAVFQWGIPTNDVKITFAYNPVNPATGGAIGWSNNYYNTVWDNIKAAQETCPSGWRRPNDGSTSNLVAISATPNYINNNIYSSEMRQSLFALPKNGKNGMGETVGRAWGYYADGYFDRRPILHGLGTGNMNLNTAVSNSSKDVAYIGTLFFNAANNHSLFMPAAGWRNPNGVLTNASIDGFYWSSSAEQNITGWCLTFGYSNAQLGATNKPSGMQVRCVVNE
jgi:hypothetical protein